MNRRRLPSSSGSRPARTFPGAKLFIELTDTPGNYTAAAGKFVVVNGTATGLEYIPLPPLAITDTYVVNSQAAMLALAAQTGDIAVRTDTQETYILQGTDPTNLGDWVKLLFPALAAHDLAGAYHNADTITNLNLKLSDGDVISTKAAEVSAMTAKASPTTSDFLMIEDAADGNKKKSITIAGLPAAAPAAHDLAGALHNADTITNLNLKLSDGDVISTKAGEVSAMTAKASPTTSDFLMIEDAADGNKKKRITIATLPAAAPAAHDLAGALHNADTITNLNLKLSDGDVISTKAGEVSAMTAKASPTTSDFLMIEDAADGNKKKSITIAALPAMGAHDLAGALHNADTITNLNLKLSDGDVISTKAAEINAFTQKTVPVNDDLLMIEDSADTNKKKKIKIGDSVLAIPALNYQIEQFHANNFGLDTNMPATLHNSTRGNKQFSSMNFVGNADTAAFLHCQRHDYYDHAAATPTIDIDFNFFPNTAPGGTKTIRWGVKAYYISDGVDLATLTNPAISAYSDYQNISINAVGLYKKVVFSGIQITLVTGSTWDTHGKFIVFIGRYATHADDDYSAGGAEVMGAAIEYSLKSNTP